MKLAAIILVLIACIGCGVQPSADKMVGSVAPDFTVESLSTKTPTKLSSLKGKVVLLDFWATWCGPCRTLMPEIQDIHLRLSSKGVAIMAITTEERAKVADFEKSSGTTYPIYLDKSYEANKAYEVTAFPHLVLIGKNGRVAWVAEGVDPNDPDAVVKKAESLLQ